MSTLKDEKIVYNDNPLTFKGQLHVGFTEEEAKQNLKDSEIILYAEDKVKKAITNFLAEANTHFECCVYKDKEVSFNYLMKVFREEFGDWEE